MIKLEKTEVVGWEPAIRGMRNPMNSWENSDSYYAHVEDETTGVTAPFEFFVGGKDHELMMKLAKGGPVHAKYRRMITVYVDITAPLYWWKEFDTYKVGTVANSCSTMHKIHAKEFTLEDFSHEKLKDGIIFARNPNGIDEFSKVATNPLNVLKGVIDSLNTCCLAYLQTNDKECWEQMIQLLPSSYNQKRTVELNYEVLVGIYKHRKNHKLDEWRELCSWIESLPYSEIITLEAKDEEV